MANSVPASKSQKPGLHLLRCSPEQRRRFLEQGRWPSPLSVKELWKPSRALRIAAGQYVEAEAFFHGAMGKKDGVLMIAHGDLDLDVCESILDQHPCSNLIERIDVRPSPGGEILALIAIIAGVHTSDELTRRTSDDDDVVDVALARMQRFCAANADKLPSRMYFHSKDVDVSYLPEQFTASPLDDEIDKAELDAALAFSDLAAFGVLSQDIIPAGELDQILTRGRERATFSDSDGDVANYAAAFIQCGEGDPVFASVRPQVMAVLQGCRDAGLFEGAPSSLLAVETDIFDDERNHSAALEPLLLAVPDVHERVEEIVRRIIKSLGYAKDIIADLMAGEAEAFRERYLAEFPQRLDELASGQDIPAAVLADTWEPPRI